MDQIDFRLSCPWWQPERFSDSILEGAFYATGAIDIIVSVPFHGFHFGKILFVGEPSVDQGFPERGCPFVAGIIVDGRQWDEAHRLPVVELEKDYVRQFIHRTDMRIRAGAELSSDQWVAPAQVEQFGSQIFNLLLYQLCQIAIFHCSKRAVYSTPLNVSEPSQYACRGKSGIIVRS
jgi:hypothetical protein